MALSSIKIREAEASDIEAMVALLKELFSVERDFTFNKSLHRRGLALMLEEPERRCIMVAEAEQGVIAMCSVQLIVSTAEGGLADAAEDMVVMPEYRRQGIGKNLLESVQKWAEDRGAKRLQLLADQNNIPALEFYEKMNWRKTQMIWLWKK